MKKVLVNSLVMLVVLLMVSCGSDRPWVGEWVPANQPEGGVIELNSDGSAAYDQESSDGSIYIKGSWEASEDSANSFTLKFDSNTVKVSADNPFVEMILSQAAQAMTSTTITGVVSEDGDHLSFNGDAIGYVRK